MGWIIERVSLRRSAVFSVSGHFGKIVEVREDTVKCFLDGFLRRMNLCWRTIRRLAQVDDVRYVRFRELVKRGANH